MASISSQNKTLSEVTTSSLDALKQYSVGIEEHRRGFFDEAKSCYENALDIDPDFTAARASLGMLSFEKFDKDEGKQLLAAAVEDLDKLTTKERYGILAFYARAVDEDLEQAVEYSRRLVTLYPDYAAAHNNLGWFLSQLGRYAEAATEYEEAIRIDPHFVLAYTGLSWVYLDRLAEIEAAIDLCERALSLGQSSPWLYDCLGWAHLGKGDLAQAEEAFQKALAVYPAYALDLFRLAHTYSLQERYPQAIDTLQEILALDSTSSGEVLTDDAISAHYDLAAVYQQMGDESAASDHLEIYRQAAERWIIEMPDNPDSHFALALALSRLGRSEEAWLRVQEALEIAPDAHFAYAEFLSVEGKVEEALDRLELAVKEGYSQFIWIRINPNFRNLSGEPRFQALLEKYGQEGGS